MKNLLILVAMVIGLYLFTPDSNYEMRPKTSTAEVVEQDKDNSFREKLLAIEIDVEEETNTEDLVVQEVAEKGCGCLDESCKGNVDCEFCECEYCACDCQKETASADLSIDVGKPEYDAPYILVLNFDKSNWWEKDKDKWENVGWNVYGEFGHQELSQPIFKVYNNGKESIFVGDLSADDVRRSFDLGEKPVTTNSSGRWTAQELTQMVNSIYRNEQVPLYGTMKSDSQVWRHLKYDTKHGYTSEQVDGLPMSVAVKLHNLDHGNRITPFRTKTSSRVQPQVRIEYTPFTGGNCATGNCATQYRIR